jgi:hypothetical protein
MSGGPSGSPFLLRLWRVHFVFESTALKPNDDDIDLRELSALDLINLLDRVHPHRNISVGESEIEAHRRAGARDLIDELLAMAEEDNG